MDQVPRCSECALPMSLADGAHFDAPYWTCDGPNDNTTEKGCSATLPVTAVLACDITANDLALDSLDEDGYNADDVIGPAGTTVTIFDSNGTDMIEVRDFANDPFVEGFVNRTDLEGV